MKVVLTDSERAQLRQLQRQRRDGEGYVKVTVMLLLDKSRPVGAIAEDLGLDESTIYRYASAFTLVGVARYLTHEQPGYWGLLTSAQFARLGHQLDQVLYTDVRQVAAWLA